MKIAKTWIIDKEFDFCYGHRVWSQQLNPEFCEVGDACAKCRHLHGHQGIVHVFLEANTLNRGMVEDFKHLGWFKNFLDDHLDHKFILDINDPWFSNIINGKPILKDGKLTGLDVAQLNTSSKTTLTFNPVYVPETELLAGWELDIKELSGPEQEFFEGFFVVNFLPTSENLAHWMFNCVQEKMRRINVTVHSVSLNETPKSRATFTWSES